MPHDRKITGKMMFSWIKSHKLQLIALSLIFAMGIATLVQYLNQYNTVVDWNYPENSQEYTVENAAGWAADWLVQSVKSDGKFKYEYFIDSDTYSANYNYLRHWGTAYSMIYYYDYSHDPFLLAAVKKTFDWGLKYFREFDDNANIGYFFYGQQSTSGGPALALMALTQYYRSTNDTTYLDYMNKLGNFLLWMQQPEGWIRSYYIKDGSTENYENTSYYPSETLLAYALMFKVTDNPAYTQALEDAYQFYSIRENFNYYDSPFIPWTSSAFSEIYKLTGITKYANFAFKLIDSKIATQTRNMAMDSLGNNLLGSIQRSIATSSHMEGLGDCYSAATMMNDTERMAEYEYAMRIGIEWLLSLQMQYDECQSFNLTHPERAFGGFRFGFTTDENMTMRNDYTQHTLSAIIKYLKFFPQSVINATIFR